MSKNILIVEHREDLLIRLKEILLNQGYNVFLSRSKTQAITIPNENTIDLILLDSDVSHGYGSALIEVYKNQPQTMYTPLILLTTPYKKQDFIEYTLNLDIDGLIFIPFDETDLIVKIASVMKYRNLILEKNKLLDNINTLQSEVMTLRETSANNFSDYQKMKKKYEEAVTIDIETGIYNKNKFLKEFRNLVYETVRHEETIVLAAFAIDGLIEYSKEFGENVKEAIVKKFVAIITSITRKEDIVGRFEENIFFISFKRMNENLYENKIEEIKSLVKDIEINYNDMTIKFSVTVGLSISVYKVHYKIDDSNIEKEVSAALLALHNAKRRGAGSVFLHPVVKKV